MDQNKYFCRYCERKMNKVDYEINNGFCGKCREILDWKKILNYKKNFEE